MMLDRDTILAAQDLPMESLNVPEWGGTVHVRVMTGAERDAFEASLIAGGGKTNVANVRARLAVLCICDESGQRLFGDDDVTPLGQKSAAALDRIFTVAQRINHIGAHDIEDLAGN